MTDLVIGKKGVGILDDNRTHRIVSHHLRFSGRNLLSQIEWMVPRQIPPGWRQVVYHRFFPGQNGAKPIQP